MNPLDIARIRSAYPEKRIDYYPSLESTMLAAEKLDYGSVVLADEQVAGQGRHGHSWHSEPNAGIYFSVVLEPAPVLTLALGLAAQSAIRESTGIQCDIRWPNDLMLEGKKTGGILVQASRGRAVAGIGINVGHRKFPVEIAHEATSLALCTAGAGRCPSREDIVIALIAATGRYTRLEKDSVLREFARCSTYASGKHVTISEGGRVVEGVTAGLDESGFLRVRKGDGTDTLIVAGGVRATGS